MTMSDTRTALLEAGVRLYGSMANELLRGLSAGSVAGEAGYHRQTFYRYWETQSEYVQDLIRHVLGTDMTPVADGAAVLADRRRPTDLEPFVKDLAEHDFVRVAEDPGAMMRIGLLMMDALKEEALHELAQEFYDTTIARLSQSYEELFEAVDREPAEPATTRDVVRVVQALLVGLVLQSKAADDDPHAGVLFEWGALAVLEGLTDPAEGTGSATG
jgi:AcrR family transcriptional regulator